MNCENCIKKCKAACCGIVPFPKDFVKNNPVLKNVIKTIEMDDKNVILETEDNTCPYLDENYKCSIYESRPEVCRKFGNEEHPMLICSYQDKNGRLRSRQEKRSIERSINKNFDIFMNNVKILD